MRYVVARTRNPGTRAEGRFWGYPYDTELVSSEGCHMHVWLGDRTGAAAKDLAANLARKANDFRDVVSFSWSEGVSAGYWADSHYPDARDALTVEVTTR